MILCYKKKTGEIISYIDGRVHDDRQLNVSIETGEELGKYVIGWEESKEFEEYEDEVEDLVEVSKGLFKKVKKNVKMKRRKRIEHNLDKFEILQRFEDATPENPMDYKIENNNLIKK